MKFRLYYSPGACSMASHIALLEARADFVLEKVDLRTHRTTTQSFYDINAAGAVPVLDLLDSGERLTENVAILTLIASRYPQANLIPSAGTIGYFQVLKWLGFITSEIHKQFAPYFHPNATTETKAEASAQLTKCFVIIDEALRSQTYLAGANLSVADFYLFVMENWLEKFRHPISQMSSIQHHLARMRELPSVQKALNDEGLSK